jgi:methyl coenzyme M reductase subunit C-like uncharacterized protein (methanogenesis marker protein 7)
MIKEHSLVVLTESVPGANLLVGDVGVVVHVHRNREAYEIEFLALDGNTIAVETLAARQVRAATNHDIPHVRQARVA